MKITFNGAAQRVTGSCHLIETNGIRFLLDCGQFQGKDAEKLNERLPFDAKTIAFVILSHAHLDHCGRLPLLIKNGFRGRIFATKGTIDLSRLILMDAAKVERENTKTLNRKRQRMGLPLIKPLFTMDDVFDTFPYFEGTSYGKWISVSGIRFRFLNAGHILCSAFVEVEIEGKRLTFSGDLGNKGDPLLNDPEPPEKSDIIITETTYANRKHKSFKESKLEFEDAIISTFKRDGIVLIPSFALERAQVVLYVLKEMFDEGKLPMCRVFLDSPLAISITRTFKRHTNCLRTSVSKRMKNGWNPFEFPYLRITETPDESKKINSISENAIIIAGNGMCTGGRIMHHLKHHLWERKNSIIFVGYQAEGTTGRQIVDGARRVEIFDEKVNANSKVYTINGFSSHADEPQIFSWLKKGIKKDTELILVHGEKPVMESFKGYIETTLGIKPIMPKLYQTIEV